ncbi:hypothetical protein [Desertivirga brevis]|uniref:hypothetical protein n=1 Tax=Desertivirga brevis TaxID=2810310 RepID=UPI001A9685B7|nr:hypothetical protein [Pedobacter sp. SYSU D00873]
MISKLKKRISDSLLSYRGWKTNRKIVVIESDDWGAIRMPSSEVYNALLKENIRVDKCAYSKFDSLESVEDLSELFNVLSKYKDKHDSPAVITANFIMTNPDFRRMKQDNPSTYKNELFTETYKSYEGREGSLELVLEGGREGLLKAQCHGREHVNVLRWLKFLNSGSRETMLAFNHNLFGLSQTITSEDRGSFMAAYDYKDESEKSNYQQIVSEALELFHKTFNYHSSSFIAPNYCWDDDVELGLFRNDVRIIQSGRVQVRPSFSGKAYVKHYTGERNKLGQVYTVRNCHFEPSLRKNRASAIDSCLKEMETAFFWKTPAIVCSHRLNYIGSIDPDNRAENLLLLNTLLTQIVRKWPEVEFMSSDQLGRLILSDIQQ